MDKKLSHLLAFFLCGILLAVLFTGCVNKEQKSEVSTDTVLPEVTLDQPSVLPNWTDGEYHDYYGTIEMLNGFNEKYPDLVDMFSIGKSVLGNDIWCIKLTNKKNDTIKSSCLIDGCIHGNEWEGGEACLYLAEYLLINFDANETITQILNSSEIYIIPLVNPDGRQENTRWNENGIDLNRNFDIGFGRLLPTRGGVFRFGKLFGFIKIPYIKLGKYVFENCGRRPFSEPESQALRDLMRELKNNDFSFYVNCHTADHSFYIPWGVFKPPFEMTEQETNLFNYVLNWVEKNTEYGIGSDVSVNNEKIYYYSGMADDWCFKESRIPSFCFEILSPDYFPSKGGIPWDAAYLSGGKHDHLVHWMETTLPVFMYLLVNIDNLRQWKTPDIQPLLPEGVPPEPLQ
ncbi:MAG: M14 family zinc carboxypeptidase [Euryarchaeota archaeon]|nr:M14 family zinc carboxypeptidase [Euryarchaeota archaeon]